MKTALCFTGTARSLEYTYENLKHNLIVFCYYILFYSLNVTIVYLGSNAKSLTGVTK